MGRQTNPDKMEFEGQFVGHGKQTIDDHFINGKPTTARACRGRHRPRALEEESLVVVSPIAPMIWAA